MMTKVIENFKQDRFAELCGIEILDVRPGHARCSMPVTERHLNGLETVMGGAVFTLADFTYSLAANSRGGVAVSLNAFISHLRKCTRGVITAEATELSTSSKTGLYRVSVTDDQNQIIAEFTGTAYLKVPRPN